MTTIERWTKGISGAIGMMLGAAFLLYSFDRSGRGDSEVTFIAGGLRGPRVSPWMACRQ